MRPVKSSSGSHDGVKKIVCTYECSKSISNHRVSVYKNIAAIFDLYISCNEGSKLVKEFFCVDLLYLLLQIQINSFSNQSFPVEIVDDCFFSDSGTVVR